MAAVDHESDIGLLSKILTPRGQPRAGGEWLLLEMTDASLNFLPLFRRRRA